MTTLKLGKPITLLLFFFFFSSHSSLFFLSVLSASNQQEFNEWSKRFTHFYEHSSRGEGSAFEWIPLLFKNSVMDTEKMIRQQQLADKQFDSLFQSKEEDSVSLPPIRANQKIQKDSSSISTTESTIHLPSLLSSYDEAMDASLLDGISQEEEEEDQQQQHLEDVAFQLVRRGKA